MRGRGSKRKGGAFKLLVALTLVVAAASMAGAVFGGLSRMGISTGATPDVLTRHHGPLMVSAFFGAVIALERAVAVKHWWSYGAPVAAAGGGLFLVGGDASSAAAWTFVVAGSVLVAVFARLLVDRYEPHTFAMAVGAALWALGNALWALGVPISEVVPWWAAFLVLTIAGERLELSRFRMSEASRAPFWIGFGLAAAALAGTLVSFDIGVRLLGAAFIVLAAWLAGNDVARSTIRMTGAPRFMATALFAGYFWLAAAGLFAALYGGVRAGLMYDATWHAIFVGFVFSMVFAHAQVILPALSGLKVRHGRRFYMPLVVLHLATVARVAGDLWPLEILRRAGGIGHALAIAHFAVVLASSVNRRRR